MYIIVWIISLYYNRLSSSLLTASHGPSAVTRLFSRTQFRSSVSSHGPNSVALSLLTDPIPLLCLFSRAQFRCPSLLTDPVPLPVSSHGPSTVALSLLTDTVPFLYLFSRTQFRCTSLITDPVPFLWLFSRNHFHCLSASHGPLPCVFPRTQLGCPVLCFRPSSVAPSVVTDPVQCPVHWSVLFHPVSLDPVQHFLAIRTNSSATDQWTFRGINTNVCGCLSLRLGSFHFIR